MIHGLPESEPNRITHEDDPITSPKENLFGLLVSGVLTPADREQSVVNCRRFDRISVTI
jgi:hypothetical protein